MALKSNLEYWKYSLKHPEPIFEDYYIKDDLIVENKDLIEKVERLRELIISYCVIIEKNEETAQEILDEIYDIITSVENINYSEFVAFWNAMDLSESNKNIHYTSFMDGIYFNKFIKKRNCANEGNKSKKRNKVQNQIKDIEKHLKNNKNNFFVNTEGFKLILNDLNSQKLI